MSMAVNLYTPLAVILFFTMLTTLRFSFAGTLKTANLALRLLTHPAWLYPLVLAGGYTLGAFYHGTLSPWPPATFTAVSQRSGFWAAVTATEAAITVDIWLLWATATTFKTFSPADDQILLCRQRPGRRLSHGPFPPYHRYGAKRDYPRLMAMSTISEQQAQV